MADALTCPGCRASISEERRLDGVLPIPSEENPPERTCFACPGCLAIVAVEYPVRPYRPYWDRPPEPAPEPKTVLLVSGAAVARALERIRADAPAGLDVIAELRADETLRLVLRIPEVFAEVRPLFGTKAVVALPGWFEITRESRARAVEGGGVSVEGFWSPQTSEPELIPGHPMAEKRWLELAETKDEPWLRLPPPVLQAAAGEAMLVRGAPLDVVGEDRTFLKVRPLDSQWVKAGAITFLRATLDLLAPDPDRI